MAQGAVAPLAINSSSLTATELHEILQCEKLLRFRDEVLSGTHPRIKAPANLVGKLSSGATRTTSSPISTTQRANAVAVASPNTPILAQIHDGSKDISRSAVSPKTHMSGAEKSGPPHSTTSTSADINPVLLEKSEDLIKAEIQLSRQRLERALRDQVEQRRLAAKAALQTSEALPDFDLSEVLATALTLVKPTDTVEDSFADAPTSVSDSFDDNTFYSSQHDTPERSPASRRDLGKVDDFVSEVDARLPVSHSGRSVDAPEDVVMTGVSASNVKVGASYGDNQPQRKTISANSISGATSGSLSTRQVRDSQNETSDAVNTPSSQDVVRPIALARASPGVAQVSTRSGLPESTYEAPRPTNNAPQRPGTSPLIHAGHNLSPVAPQPARVSPLATRGLQIIDQDTPPNEPHLGPVSVLRRASGADSTETSPRGEKAARRAKKKASRKASKQNAVVTPESPYIKPEPRSPSPFDSGRPLRPAKRQKQNPRPLPAGGELIYDEPRWEEIREVSRRDTMRYEEQPVGIYGREPDVREPISEVVMRDEPGVRRYVSQDYIVRDDAPPRSVIHGVDSIPSHLIRRQPPTSIVPTQVTVDRYGRESYFSPQPSNSLRQSIAPITRRRDDDIYYERAPVRSFSTRPPDVFEEGGYIYRRAMSPPSGSRRIVTQPEGPIFSSSQGQFYSRQQTAAPPSGEYIEIRRTQPEGIEAGYTQREYSTRQRTVAPTSDEYVQGRAPMAERRQMSHFEEVSQPGYVQRVASVRPEGVVRYEDSRAYRVASVRPERKEYAGSTRTELGREMGPPIREYSSRPEPIEDFGRRPDMVARGYSIRPVETEAYQYSRPSVRRSGDIEYLEEREVARDIPPDVFMDGSRREYR